jgi:hypothetical protein
LGHTLTQTQKAFFIDWTEVQSNFYFPSEIGRLIPTKEHWMTPLKHWLFRSVAGVITLSHTRLYKSRPALRSIAVPHTDQKAIKLIAAENMNSITNNYTVRTRCF